jgi:hypothetical protein
MTTSAAMRSILFAATQLLLAAGAGNTVAQEARTLREDVLACTAPLDLQLIRSLDFGRIVMDRERSGQVDVDADGSYRQLGGAFVSLPPAAAELQFCGPAGMRFELRIDGAVDTGQAAALLNRGAAQLAAGSLRVSARGAELRRLGATVWEGVIGDGGRVSVRITGRLDISSRAGKTRAEFRIPVSLRSL